MGGGGYGTSSILSWCYLSDKAMAQRTACMGGGHKQSGKPARWSKCAEAGTPACRLAHTCERTAGGILAATLSYRHPAIVPASSWGVVRGIAAVAASIHVCPAAANASACIPSPAHVEVVHGACIKLAGNPSLLSP